MSSPIVLLHGLTFDRRHWDPLIRELSAAEPDRKVLALDLPGHGDAPRRSSYHLEEVAEVVHGQILAAGLAEPPTVVGHSVGGVIATVYAARNPTRAVVNLDQYLLPGPFGDLVRSLEPELRGPGWRAVWDRMTAGMGIESLRGEAREIVETATDPRPDLLLGYWDEVIHGTDERIAADRRADLRAIAERGAGYRWVTAAVPPAPYVAWLKEALPTSVVTVLPGGHLMPLEHPAELARLLSDQN
ncbi:alpha/beta fold hydrolase [Actinoplanes solisilvae]|uniref:alpha/beta fold hydrolase n=1 Tax=Actinoplanes solisilvae TaxID=2486853 RepID=UPI000FD87F2C|nr:alpha/beta hydrolase [Actinoplanes solisilvae]